MKLVNGFYFPDDDVECQKVAHQVTDVDLSLKHCRKFDVCIQAGGNVGIWPKYLAEKFGYVFTFEPDRENFHCLIENISGIKNIHAENLALGEDRRRVTLSGDTNNCGAYQIEEGDAVDMITIDSMDINVDLIYLDIEGYEYRALLGAMRTIKDCQPIITVEDKGHSEKYGTKKGDIDVFMAEMGYEVVERVHRDVVFAPSQTGE